MSSEEKKQKIHEMQEKKTALYPQLKTAKECMDQAQQNYYKEHEKWLKLKQMYEALDREEKLLANELTMAKKKLVRKKGNKKSKVNTKAAALKALNNLTEEERSQIIAKYI